MDFAGRVAIVTGGAQGIGKGISKTLLKVGMKLVICDIDESSAKLFLEEVPSDLKSNLVFQKCDVSSYEELKAVFEMTKSSHGRIDVLINNAGILNENQWKRMIEVNFIGVIHGIHLAFEFMGKNNGGSGGFIINTCSNKGLEGFDMAPIYSGTKHAIVGLTKSFGTEYHFDKTGVTVNATCPGPTDTQLFHTFPECSVDEARSMEHNSKVKPINPNEVAKAVMQLLQDGRNGALLSVDGNKGIRYEE